LIVTVSYDNVVQTSMLSHFGDVIHDYFVVFVAQFTITTASTTPTQTSGWL